MRAVKLKRYVPTVQQLSYYGAYRLKLEITDVSGDDLDVNLFLFQRTPATATDVVPRDYFAAIVSPSQLATVPVGAPNEDIAWPYFRSNEVELDCVSSQQADDFYGVVMEEITTLILALNRLDTLASVEEIWIPSTPPDSESGSGSGS
jgi:hypothetical protein